MRRKRNSVPETEKSTLHKFREYLSSPSNRTENEEEIKSRKKPSLEFPPQFSDKGNCFMCQASLGIMKFKHNCRNCGRSVCNNHSRNTAPLPKYGILKEVRVCDECVKRLVRQRIGVASPKQSKRIVNTPMVGIIISCRVEIQDNTMDDLLYFSTLGMGSRSLATRNLNANIAIWKERLFMLTHAEIMCFKPAEGSEIGEAKDTVHMTDILHTSIHEYYPKVLTILLADGRLFRLKAKTVMGCKDILSAIDNARMLFQRAMQLLHRGPCDEDNKLLMIAVKTSGMKHERIIHHFPILDKYYEMEIYSGSQVHVYVCNAAEVSVAVLSFCDLKNALTELQVKTCGIANEIVVNPLIVHATVQKVVRSTASMKKNIGLLVLAISIFFYNFQRLNHAQLLYTIILFQIVVMVLIFNTVDELRILFATGKLHQSSKFQLLISKITCDAEHEQLEQLEDEELDIRFVEGCRGDVVEARRRQNSTRAWRRQHNMDNILYTPQPHFTTMKLCYQNFIHKRDKQGHVVAFEIAGNVKKSMQDFEMAGVSQDSAVSHLAYTTEYLWSVVDTRPYPESQQLIVLDLNGIGFSDIGGDVVAFFKKCGAAIGDNNPERLFKVFIVNPPSWFNILWKLVSPIINPRTRDKTHVVRGQKEIAKALLEYIDADNLPVTYGGNCSCPGGCSNGSPFEIELREYTEQVNKASSEEDKQGLFERLKEIRMKHAHIKDTSRTS